MMMMMMVVFDRLFNIHYLSDRVYLNYSILQFNLKLTNFIALIMEKYFKYKVIYKDIIGLSVTISCV